LKIVSLFQKAKSSGLWLGQTVLRRHCTSNRGSSVRRSHASSAAIALAVALAGYSAHAQSLPTEQAAAAQSFVNSAGVVTHLTYADSAYYTDWSTILNQLEALHVKHVRDGFGYWPKGSNFYTRHHALANAGIKTDYVMPWDSTITAQTLEQFAGKVRDAEAFETANECDVVPNCGGGGATGVANALSMLPMLQTAGQALNIPVMGPSYVYPSSYPESGNISSLVNTNSMHIYFGGRYPGVPGWGDDDAQGNGYGSLGFWHDQSQIDAPGIVPTITETGYMSFPTTSTAYTIPESVETAYMQRTLLLAYKQGYERTYFYQLIDDPSSPAGYGLLRSDLTEKPAFIGLSNLLKLLTDKGSSFTPGSLPCVISGGDSNLNHLLLEKSDGSYWLVLWLEEPSWDPANSVPLSVNPENIGIELPSGWTTTADYQFNSSGTYYAFNQPMSNGWASLTVTDQLSIVKIVAQ
jgi:hypothetical protein